VLFLAGVVMWLNGTRFRFPTGSDVRVGDDGSLTVTTPAANVAKQPPPRAVAPFDAASIRFVSSLDSYTTY
jgi:hypothetical protein